MSQASGRPAPVVGSRSTAGSTRPTITVCGLGPGAPDLLTERTSDLLAGPGPFFLRTARHPTAGRVRGAESFDEVYERADSFDTVYRTISEQLVAAAHQHGNVVYCVPGSPLVLERSVAQLRSGEEVDVVVVPALSFLDEVWDRLAVDPIDAGVRLVDGHRFASEAAGERGPLLVAHAHASWVLSDIKLALLDAGSVDDGDPVVVLQRLGTADERIIEVSVADLDREIEPDHLTSLYLPTLAAPVGSALLDTVELMRRLRAECPWDREQDHGSLRRYLLEEAYETVDVLDRLAAADPVVPGEIWEELESELGDLWFQILFHAQLATESGQFDLSDVARTLVDKMVVRHPHVFGTEEPDLYSKAAEAKHDPVAVNAQWDRIKTEQNGRTSAVDDIPLALPALTRAAKVIRRVGSRFGPPQPGPAASMIAEALGIGPASGAAEGPGRGGDVDPDAVGRVLLAVVSAARQGGVDAEQALRQATSDLEALIRRHELDARGDDFERLSWVVG